MKESKRGKAQLHDHDRLSELPNSVIFHIFWFVPMNDVVKTTILSKRWRNVWTKTPFLNFDNGAPTLHEVDRFRNSVNRTLLRWNGIRVLKFKVNSLFILDDSVHSDVDLWVNWAQERNVEELYLHFPLENVQTIDEAYRLPQSLYTCSSVKVLSLAALSFKVCNVAAMYVQWNQLESLTVKECFGITKFVIPRILSGSPLLEVLNLSFVDQGANLSIRSSSLKHLSISKYLYSYGYRLDMVSELTILTPNLESLKMQGVPYTNYRLINVSSLTHASIGFRGLVYLHQDTCVFPEMDLKNGFLSSQDYIGQKFSQVLQTIQRVETISLFFCCLKVLRYMKMRCGHASFPNVKSLKVRCCYGNYEQLVGLLQIFPQIESLVLQDGADDSTDDRDEVESETRIPTSFLVQLRTIEVTWENGENIFPLIEILLKYASKLERMVFRLRGTRLPPNSLLLASNKLLNMPRASTNCKVDMIVL